MAENQELLRQTNDLIKTAIDKIDGQGQRLTGIEVKVDLYRESQQVIDRKVEDISKEATEATSSVKSAHKRLDAAEKDNEEKDKEIKTLKTQATEAKTRLDAAEKENKEKADDIKFLKRALITTILGLAGSIILRYLPLVSP